MYKGYVCCQNLPNCRVPKFTFDSFCLIINYVFQSNMPCSIYFDNHTFMILNDVHHCYVIESWQYFVLLAKKWKHIQIYIHIRHMFYNMKWQNQVTSWVKCPTKMKQHFDIYWTFYPQNIIMSLQAIPAWTSPVSFSTHFIRGGNSNRTKYRECEKCIFLT